MTNRSYPSSDLTTIHLTRADLPADLVVALVCVTFDDPAARVQSCGSRRGGGMYEAEFLHFPTDQTHATSNCAIQKTSTVDFLVPPNWGAPPTNIRECDCCSDRQ
jgi:hypothetical protein